MLLLLLGACGSDPVVPVQAPVVWVESQKVDAGAPVVLHAPAETTLPAVEGLTARQTAVSDGGEATWELHGEPGSYVLEVPLANGEPVRLFVDIGVEGPTGGPMEDLAAIPPPPPPIWPTVLAVTAGVVVAAGAGFWAWQRFRPVPPPPPPEPADRVARREWAVLRTRTDLPPEELALALSKVYRTYLDAVHAWPATSRTTREILDNLAGELSAIQLDRARRLLSAMDIVKFSDRETHASFFESLDADFDALVVPVRVPTGTAS